MSVTNIVSVALCCNDPDHGMFTGRLNAVRIGEDLLNLTNKFWPPKEPSLTIHVNRVVRKNQGCGADRVEGYVKVSRRRFSIIGYKYGWGNWCWDLVIMRPAVAIALTNYLKQLNCFQNEDGDVRWHRMFNEGTEVFSDETGSLDMREIALYGYQTP